MKESGFATPLVVLGFAALWVFPALTSIVAGDLFSAEDRYRTWTNVLTRSRSRAELFFGKVLTALGFATLAVVVLAASSAMAGILVIGRQPLIDLSGELLQPGPALKHVALAWASVLPPAFGFTALAVLLSVATRSGVAGVGLPVIAGLGMQLYAYVDGPNAVRALLITSAFNAWHGLLTEQPFYRPLIYGTAVSGVYFIVCLVIAYQMLQQRDIV
jgi:ABC-2 type transport system permease protein